MLLGNIALALVSTQQGLDVSFHFQSQGAVLSLESRLEYGYIAS